MNKSIINANKMIQEKQVLGDNITYFTTEKDEKGWCAVVTRNDKVIKKSYGLNGSKVEAEVIRGSFINKFWSNHLN